MDIPPQTASVAIIVVDQMPVPPSTQPVLTPTALTPPSLGEMETENAFHQESERKCGFPGFLAEMQSPQLVPLHPWSDASSYVLLEGRVWKSTMAGKDNELNHSSYDGHDIGVHVEPDPKYRRLKVPDVANRGVFDMEVEWESKIFPPEMRPVANDRVSVFGFLTYDCHHTDDVLGILTEIHPPVLTAVHRARPIEIPDGWGSLGSDILVPGIVTDIWASTRAGEMTSNCSTTGLHQEAVTAPPPLYVRFGDCIRSPHPDPTRVHLQHLPAGGSAKAHGGRGHDRPTRPALRARRTARPEPHRDPADRRRRNPRPGRRRHVPRSDARRAS